ncbi:MAG TPA: hypothetical protein VF223_23790, partial [Trebonia sp.]
GSVLGSLNALLSPHAVTGAPTASQAAQQGLLGKIVQVPGGDSTSAGRVSVTGLPSDNVIATTDRVNTVGLPQSGGTITTEDRVNVTGLPTSGGSITTTDRVEVDEASAAAAEAELDAIGNKKETVRVGVSGAPEAAAELAAVSAAEKDTSGNSETLSQRLASFVTGLASFGGAAKDAGTKSESLKDQLGFLAEPMGALTVAGVALAPILVTAGVGIGGFAAAAAGSLKPILDAAQATGGLQANLASLDPQQQQAAKGLLALEDQYNSFSKALAPEVFSVFNSGLKTASGLLSDVTPVAQAAGKGIDSVLNAVNADLNGAQWQQFFGWMAQNAAPDIQMLGTTIGALVDDLPQLLEGLQPIAEELLTVTTGVAKFAGALEGLPGKINQVSDSNQSLLSKASDALNALGSKIPAGNRSLLSLAEQWLGVGQNAGTAASSVKKAGDSTAAAAPQVGTLAGDMAILNSATANATTSTQAFNDEWSIFVGKSVSNQQAVLSVATAFDSYNSAVKQSGTNSTAAQTAFLGIIQSMGTGLSTLQANGATIQQVNSFYQDNIDKLNSLHGLNATQKQDIADITKDYTAWANSSSGLNSNLLTTVGTIRDGFIGSLEAIGKDSPAVNSAVGNFADAILKTGTQSSATAADRAQLIKDLENAGVDAQTAKGLVKALQDQISTLKGKNVTVSASTSAAAGAVQTFQQMINSLHGKTVTVGVQTIGSSILTQTLLNGMATGGLVTAGTGPTSDDVLVRVSKGETVVPAHLTPAFAPAFKAAGIPGFASGGVPAPGRSYVLGGGGAGTSAPGGGMHGGDPATAEIRDLLRQIHADNQKLIRATEQVPAGVGAHVGSAINGASHDASFRARYPRGGS